MCANTKKKKVGARKAMQISITLPEREGAKALRLNVAGTDDALADDGAGLTGLHL